MNKSSISDHQKIISLKWVFIYKNDSDDYLTKYKTRIVIHFLFSRHIKKK
jgi:hypothetical protein